MIKLPLKLQAQVHEAGDLIDAIAAKGKNSAAMPDAAPEVGSPMDVSAVVALIRQISLFKDATEDQVREAISAVPALASVTDPNQLVQMLQTNKTKMQFFSELGRIMDAAPAASLSTQPKE